MFYDRFKQLCAENGETPNAVCTQIGLSQAAAPYWKKSGKTPKRETLEKIADHFGVSVNYLLGRHTPAQISDNDIRELLSRIDNQDTVTAAERFKALGETKSAPIVTNRSEMFAILGQLTDSELDSLIDYARFLISKR